MSARPRLEISVAAATDVGTVREHNEDFLVVGDLDAGTSLDQGAAGAWASTSADRGPLLVVCDGMGGAAGGEVASRIAAQSIWREMKATPATPDPEVFARLLRRATRVANHDVRQAASRERALQGMGTTVSAAGVIGDRLVVSTIGDSRAYVLRAGALVQITRDQSLSSALLASGADPHEADLAGSAILQALGVDDDVDPSLSIIELRRGDRVLLCSDGLHGLIGDPGIALLMSEPHTVEHAVRLLIAAARAAGGTDNITAVVADVGGDRLAPPAGDLDLPRFREFDPQQEGDPALTSTSYVARRLAARVGLPTSSIPPTLPVTGQHAILRSRLSMRMPAQETAIPDLAGPARQRLRGGHAAWWWYVLAGIVVSLIAWVVGAR